MDGWARSGWQARQSELSWQRLRIAEAEGRLAPWQEPPGSSDMTSDPSAPYGATDGIDTNELTMRLKTLYQECESLKCQRDDWQAERALLEEELTLRNQEIEAERALLKQQQVEIEGERVELRAERRRLENVLQQFKDEMAELRRGLTGRESIDHERLSRLESTKLSEQEEPPEVAQPARHNSVISYLKPAPSDPNAHYQHSSEEISETMADSLVRFARKKNHRPVWIAAASVLLGAAIAVSCATFFAWSNLGQVKTWLAF
jgi:hypothetical protein